MIQFELLQEWNSPFMKVPKGTQITANSHNDLYYGNFCLATMAEARKHTDWFREIKPEPAKVSRFTFFDRYGHERLLQDAPETEGYYSLTIHKWKGKAHDLLNLINKALENHEQ